MNPEIATKSWTANAAEFLVRFRVAISSVLFVGLIVEVLCLQTKPNFGWLQNASWQGCLGATLVLAGLAVRSWAAGVLPKGIDLATEGPYSLCRHPLYLGSALMMLGFCLVLGYWHIYLVIFGPILGIYLLTMRREERRLAARYGERWTTYAARVPRLVPFRLGNFTAGLWSAGRWWKCREYRAGIAAGAGLVALEWWRLAG